MAAAAKENLDPEIFILHKLARQAGLVPGRGVELMTYKSMPSISSTVIVELVTPHPGSYLGGAP